MNPAIITENADVKLAAKRLAWGKVLNGGQVRFLISACTPSRTRHLPFFLI